MPVWNQALMRTRCPACGTVFRVTSEQLRLRAGKVRCGQCQTVFNAFDQLVSEENAPLVVAQDKEQLPPAVLAAADEGMPDADAAAVESPSLPSEAAVDVEVTAEPASLADQAEEARHPDVAAPEPALQQGEPTMDTDTVLIQSPLAEPLVESPEESTQAAREAGLVAAREFGEISSFNRWSAGTLASDGQGGFDNTENHRAVWPFVLVASLLVTALLGQLLYHFRTDVVLRFPGAATFYEQLAVDIPLPRDAALVSIETSDLQSENTRGLFVLQATLKNRAAHAQAWPALELSLTDTNDSVVARRIMFAADYLPPGTTADAFPANGDLAVKLSIEARNIGASGYRLYIFYP